MMMQMLLLASLLLVASATNDPHEIRKLCVESLKHVEVGTAEEEIKNGVGFYKYMFGHFPHYRKYFKGKENYTPEDVEKDEFFKVQGQKALLGVHILGVSFDVQPTFKAYTRELVKHHKVIDVILEAKAWDEFWTIWEGYLGTKTTLDDATKHAWSEVGKAFTAEALHYAAQIGMPH